MPYERRGRCVYRADTGQKVGCSKSAAEAKKHLKALYANSKDAESSRKGKR